MNAAGFGFETRATAERDPSVDRIEHVHRGSRARASVHDMFTLLKPDTLLYILPCNLPYATNSIQSAKT